MQKSKWKIKEISHSVRNTYLFFDPSVGGEKFSANSLEQYLNCVNLGVYLLV